MKKYQGLTEAEVKAAILNGDINNAELTKTKSYQQIFKDNIFTLFNLINFILALLIFSTGSYRNMLFMGVVFSNMFIGIYQEIKAKRTLDRISLIVSSKVKVIRNYIEQDININEVVLNDLMILKSGDQIVSDAVVIDGSIETDESLLTGESHTIKKNINDELFSGSFVCSGLAIARVNRVGNNNYAAKITKNARKYSKYPSEIRDTLDKIIQYIGIVIIPLGLALFCKQYFLMNNDLTTTILNVAAALIGMIPEGLVILTSIALAVGVIHLSKHKTLVQELYCIETLARVDVLCLDKTGTITEGIMVCEKYEPINNCDEKYILGNLMYALKDDNPTINALKNEYLSSSDMEIINTIAFNSERKYSGVNFKEGSYVIGAYEFIFKNDLSYMDKVNEYAKCGKRVICLASAEYVSETEISNPVLLGIIVLADKIRSSAIRTFNYLKKQNVDIKIISGDNPITVSEVAKRAQINNYDKYVDASLLNDNEIKDALLKYSVFGRVSPSQKELMIKGLKELGHTVGMSGDGVNDVLAFKEADVSIAMASGADIAKNSANLVLLDSNFDALPYVLNEGRRVINNIQKVATLFLTKTMYSCILSILLVILPFGYPFIPIQLTYISSLTIGIPSFILALEPNHTRVSGHFFDNVIKVSLPAALGFICSLNFIFLMAYINNYSQDVITTLAATRSGSSRRLLH